MKASCLLACVVLTSTLLSNSAIAQLTNDPAADFQSSDYAQRQDAIRDLNAQRSKIISEMLQILRGKYPDDVKQDAAKVLGIYRATEAVETLVGSVELDIGVHSVIRNSPPPSIHDLFPVSTALERIGPSSIPHLLKKISETDNKVLRARCLSVCVAIEGQTATQTRLQQAIDTATLPEVKGRLEAALLSLPELMLKVNFKIL